MIPKIGRGDRTRGLLGYLFGPGQVEEHTDPHLVGSWDGFAPDPGRDPNPDADREVTLSRLAAALDLRVKQAGDRAPAEHVWHCSVRTAPGDRTLSDQEWNGIAQRILHAVDIAPKDDPDGCRWVAVRHADDHIHILATMVRGDLRRPRMNYDKKQAQAECRAIETGDGPAPPPRRETAPPPRTPPAPNASKPNAPADPRLHARRSAKPSARPSPEPPARRSSSPGCAKRACA